MDLGLEGKVAIITGGSEGIGKAAAGALAREGAHVVIAARTVTTLEAAAESVRQHARGTVLAVPTDVRKVEDCERLVEAARARFGRVDILVNNAGTAAARPFESVTDAQWEEDLQLKLFAAMRLSRLVLPLLREVKGGSIVNLLNIGSKQPGANSMPSSVSRAAGLAFTKALSKELGPENIRVNAVLIGLVKSGQHDRKWQQAGGDRDVFYAAMAKAREVPLGRVGEAEEAGDLIAFLVSARGAYLNGVGLNFDGGLSAVV